MTAAHPSDADIRGLYAEFLDGWNRRSGALVAAGFTDDGDLVEADGTHHAGRLSIASHLRRVFGGATSGETWIGMIRSVRPLAEGVAVLHATVGAIPAGGDDIDPALHAVHTLVAVDEGGRWKISLLQSTPATWGGAPGAREAFTEELRGLLAPM